MFTDKAANWVMVCRHAEFCFVNGIRDAKAYAIIQGSKEPLAPQKTAPPFRLRMDHTHYKNNQQETGVEPEDIKTLERRQMERGRGYRDCNVLVCNKNQGRIHPRMRALVPPVTDSRVGGSSGPWPA